MFGNPDILAIRLISPKISPFSGKKPYKTKFSN
jgi:hypothetical protein